MLSRQSYLLVLLDHTVTRDDIEYYIAHQENLSFFLRSIFLLCSTFWLKLVLSGSEGGSGSGCGRGSSGAGVVVVVVVVGVVV